jgi:serine phosphatase RsbU (regulator of sigma subunit)/pSer/pThr/pTyr-binding forkhead associated (FHA) protein
MAGSNSQDIFDRSRPPLSLIAVSGPRAVALALDSKQDFTIGRRAAHQLPLDHPEVSKDHATIAYRADQSGSGWVITDIGSRHGTRLNGIALTPNRETPISPGDLIEISPWTFSVIGGVNRSGLTSRVNTVDDMESEVSAVSTIRPETGRELAQERLRLLLRCAETLQAVKDDFELAQVVLDTAVAGTGFANAAIFRPMTPDGAIEIIVSCGDIAGSGRSPRLSRSLVHAAGKGVPVQLMGSPSNVREAVSIMEFGIQEAICVPLMMESTVAGFLYLDSRGAASAGTIGANEACAFAVGVGRLASMAWANLMRLELERRYARMEGELAAAAHAQQLILPRRHGQCGSIEYVGECKPGRTVSGDFFDVFALPDGRVAVTIGDVSGKGVAASVVMTTTQGFLHGALRHHGDVARALHELNAYVHERCESQIFVTLWAGVIEAAGDSLTYVDAGHGYAWHVGTDRAITHLNLGGGPPIAIESDSTYAAERVAIRKGDRLCLVSDGIIEQQGHAGTSVQGMEFGTERLESCMQSINEYSEDEVSTVFAALHAHAGTKHLSDDATVVVIRL